MQVNSSTNCFYFNKTNKKRGFNDKEYSEPTDPHKKGN